MLLRYHYRLLSLLAVGVITSVRIMVWAAFVNKLVTLFSYFVSLFLVLLVNRITQSYEPIFTKGVSYPNLDLILVAIQIRDFF